MIGEEVDLDELIRFARAWASLGDAVISQVESLLDGEDVNPIAIRLARSRLGRRHEDLDRVFDQWEEER